MTRQTPTHIEHTTLNPRARGAHDIVRQVEEGQLDVDPPYQRGSVWTSDQRVALVRSWMIGLPAGVIIISDRDNPNWAAATEDVYKAGAAVWAAVDGKQRILTYAGSDLSLLRSRGAEERDGSAGVAGVLHAPWLASAEERMRCVGPARRSG